jgi:putative membrane protein
VQARRPRLRLFTRRGPRARFPLLLCSSIVCSVRAIHWGFGALVGGVYGALAEYQPAITSRLGASFGLTLCGITHASALPMMGLTESPENQPAREHASELVTHAIYGVTTEVVRRAARRAL